jgi:hypothetical protein
MTIKNCLYVLLKSERYKTLMVTLLGILNYINKSNIQGFGLETLNNVYFI